MSLTNRFTVRRASVADATTIAHHRCAMFLEMQSADEAALDEMAARFTPWVEEKLVRDEYLGWLVIAADGSVAAGAGMWLMEWPPHYLGRSLRRGYLMNVYTEANFRRLGLAKELVETAMEWCRNLGVDVMVLHASDAGRPMYEARGLQVHERDADSVVTSCSFRSPLRDAARTRPMSHHRA